MRAIGSLLLGSGHREARFYSVGTLWREAEFVRLRENTALANSTTAFQLVANTVMGGKKSGKELQQFIKRLTEDE